MFKLIVVILFSIISQTKCAELVFEVHVSARNYLELDCNHTLNPTNEIFNRIVMRKDGIVFNEYNLTNKDKPNYTKPNGITEEVVVHGGCRFTFKNVKDATLGVYEINLFYDINGQTNPKSPGANRVTKKYRVKRLGACTQKWEKATPGKIPNGAFVFGKDNKGNDLICCRGDTEGKMTPGSVTPNGCLIPYGNNALLLDKYEVLTGSGFQFVQESGSNQDVPLYSLVAGEDIAGKTYVGRCNIHNEVFLGKISFGFYYAYNNTENKDCKKYEILLCKS